MMTTIDWMIESPMFQVHTKMRDVQGEGKQ